jgi:flagellar biosynthesis protein FlhG
MKMIQKKVIAVTGGKGGVGKTQIAANIATLLASKNQKTFLLDGDFGLANVDLVLGLKTQFNLYHFLYEGMSLEEIMTVAPSGLKIISGGSGIQKLAQLNRMQQANLIKSFDDVYDKTDNLIIDTAAGLHESVCQLLSASANIIIVINKEITSIKDAYALIKIVSGSYQKDSFQVIVNMASSEAEGYATFKHFIRIVNQFLNVNIELLGIIPNDEYIRKAIIKQQPVVEAFPGSKSAKAFDAIVNRLEQVSYIAPSGGISFFFEKLMLEQSGFQQGVS